MKKGILILNITIALLIGCEKFSQDDKYDWNDVSFNRDVALTTIYMVNENLGFLGGNSNIKIDSIITYSSEVPTQFGDTLIFSPNEDFYIRI